MNRQTAVEFLDTLRAERGEDALKDRSPIALAIQTVPGYTMDKVSALYEPSMLVYPVADPVITAYMVHHDATPRGSMSWQIGLGDNADTSPVARMLQCTHPGVVVPERWAYTSKAPRDLLDISRRTTWRWREETYRHPLLAGIFGRYVERHTRLSDGVDPYPSLENPARFGVITFGLKHNSLWFKVFTNNLVLPDELVEEVGPIDLNLRPAGKSRRLPKPIRPAAAVAICEWAQTMGLELVDVDGSGAISDVRQRLSRSVVAWTRPGRPAQAEVSFGTEVQGKEAAAKRYGIDVRAERDYTVFEDHYKTSATMKVNRASALVRLDAASLAELKGKGTDLVMHPAVADMAELASASSVDDERLLPRQREAVGRHIATRVGYANVSSTGSGKSVMALDGMRRRALELSSHPSHPGYRGLVVAEANVRKQFVEHAEEWFPEATVLKVESSAQADEFAEIVAQKQGSPVVVVTSYSLASAVADLVDAVDLDAQLAAMFDEDDNDENPTLFEAAAVPEPVVEHPSVPAAHTADAGETDAQELEEAPAGQLSLFDAELRPMVEVVAEPAPVCTDDDPRRSLGELLMSIHWDDLIADEAACLRNHRSKQSRALWAIRKNADVAVALTGTPIARGLDDIGRIVSWARNDEHMFAGIKLAEHFDLSSKEGVADFSAAFGPVLFRMDRLDFETELPVVEEPEILVLEPSLAEKRLANAARNELKRAYEELVACLQYFEEVSTDTNGEEVAKVKEALVQARGAWLGGTQLARMAASDPAALLGSNSAGAALLAGQGLIAEATAVPGTKRKAIVEMCVRSVAEGERILVFTEFASVARELIKDLRASGARTGEILGGGGKKRDEYIEEFRNGNLDVMVATSAGERGLNLQTASMLIHYDLPWTPSSVIQRTGRVDRIGSTSKQIRVVIPVMSGTIEERVAAVVAVRAVEMMQALDATRGRSAKDSEFGHTFSGLVNSANLNELSNKDATLLEITRELLA
ncbi:MAG: helicase-related protein [Acidimicrobiales bacterium]